MTEQTGENSEVLPGLPAVDPGEPPAVGPQVDAAPGAESSASVAEPGESASPMPETPTAADGASSGADGAPSEQAAAAEQDSGDARQTSENELVVPTKAKAKGGSARSRKAAAAAPPTVSQEPKSDKLEWYILKVQSNREDSIREGLLRRVSIQGLDRYFGEVIVPTEKVTEFKGGKKRVIKRKLYPGYLVVHMEINEDTWFLVRETPGIGDFTGASGVPTPMLPHEVERIIAKQEEKSEKAPDLKIPFAKGDRVKVIEGNFENFEGEVDAIDKTNGRVTVMITIFNRTTPVEFEYWQVESV